MNNTQEKFVKASELMETLVGQVVIIDPKQAGGFEVLHKETSALDSFIVVAAKTTLRPYTDVMEGRLYQGESLSKFYDNNRVRLSKLMPTNAVSIRTPKAKFDAVECATMVTVESIQTGLQISSTNASRFLAMKY